MSRRKTLTPYLSNEIHDRVTKYCAASGHTYSQFAETAFREFLDQSSDRPLLLKRLGRMERRIGALLRLHQRDFGILFELLGVFLLQWMEHNPEFPQGQRDVVRKVAVRRMNDFEELVARRFKGEKRFLKDLVEEPLAEDAELQEAARPLDSGPPSPQGATAHG
jgi:hypothetical protein